MKKIFIIFLGLGGFLSVGASPLEAAAPQALESIFIQSQKNYDSGDYAGAAAGYAQLAQAHQSNAAYLYDLGNALFKEGRLGPAIASYERAFAVNPRNPDIRYNLDFALKQSGETLVPPGVPAVLFDVFYWFSIPELKGLQWIMCWLAMLLAGLWALRAKTRVILGRWVLALLAAWIFWGGWLWVRLSLEPNQLGVIISASSQIRSGPGDKFNVTFTAPEGRRIEILGIQGNWLEIGVLKEGVQGWIRSGSVEKI
ncbi:MAG: tetratricopeptide repeat protein [Elusimicrobiota bacterium]